MVSQTGQPFINRMVDVSPEKQTVTQFMMIEKLDLNHLRYVMTVAARTDAGWGPETEGIVIGSGVCVCVCVCIRAERYYRLCDYRD